jgi:hypothetical protein
LEAVVIGTKVKRARDGAVFKITGQHGQACVLTPDEFGSPIEETIAGLHDGYRVTVKGDSLPHGLPPTEQDVLRERDAESNRSINQTYARAVLGDRAQGAADEFEPPEGSPEAIFRKVAEDAS